MHRSYHTKKNDFIQYTELGQASKAEIADGKYLTIEGYGMVIGHSIMPNQSASLQIQNVLNVPQANKWLFSLIAIRQYGSLSQTMNKDTTVSQNGTPCIVGLPKSEKLHFFDMVLIKNKNEIPQAIIATISDYTSWHRRMGHTHQHMIKHLKKKHRRWSSSNHQCTSWSLWGMWKRKVQETSFPSFKIKGKTTLRSGTFQSGWNASSLYWWIQIYHHLLRQLLFFWGHALPQKEKWRITCNQTIQSMGQKTTWHHTEMQTIWSWRVPVKWAKNLHGREWNWIPNVHARFSATKWMSGKVPVNHHKWSWGHVASHWLIQQFLDICCEG